MKKEKILIPVLLILVLSVLFAVFSPFRSDDSIYMVSGIVESREVEIAPTLPGRIDAILADEGDSVKKGQLLVQMDDRELKIKLDRAQAVLKSTEAKLQDMEDGARPQELASAKASMEAAKATYQKAVNDKKRAEELFKESAASEDSLENAQLRLDTAEKNLEKAKEHYNLLKSGNRKNLIESTRYRVIEAKRALEALMVLNTDSRIFSPIDGIITIRSNEPGEVVSLGAPILTLINPADCYVKIYLSETVLARVKIGQKVKILTDSFPDSPFEGTLTYISSDSEFTPRNIQTREERIKLVFAAKVKTENRDLLLKPGMPVDVLIDLIDKKSTN